MTYRHNMMIVLCVRGRPVDAAVPCGPQITFRLINSSGWAQFCYYFLRTHLRIEDPPSTVCKRFNLSVARLTRAAAALYRFRRFPKIVRRIESVNLILF